MTASPSSQVLLTVGNGLFPESFSTIGGMQVTELRLQNRPQEATALGGDGWRSLLAGAGSKSIRISGDGVFVDSAAEERIRALAFTAGLASFTLIFGNGSTMSGAFMLSDYERRAEIEGEEHYAITLESSGAVMFTS